jgi:isopenicillin-N N-acyltransferase-like protein
MSNDRLELTELAGSALACGTAYGQAFETRMLGFCRQEVTPTKQRLQYAKRCWRHVERMAPTSATFMRGMARGSRLSLEHVTLLSLHDEIHHQPHCTAFAAGGGATRGGKTIVGQNWDWATNLYPWAGLLRLDVQGELKQVTYHYPGLWSSAGVNEAGLSLMWTGGGYFPKVAPVVGMPTYVLIAEILRRRTVDEALDYLRQVKHAGSFIFFLGDASGATTVVEAVPDRLVAESGQVPMCRANHYESADILACAAQVKPSRRETSTLQRASRMGELVAQHDGRISTAVAKRILTDRGTDWPWLHQFPGGRKSHELVGMTVDSLFAVCEDRELWTCRGGRTPGPWQRVRV